MSEFPPEEYRDLLGQVLAEKVGCTYMVWPPPDEGAVCGATPVTHRYRHWRVCEEHARPDLYADLEHLHRLNEPVDNQPA